MKHFSTDDFEGKVDSLYRLVIIGAQRARQVSRPETRPLVPTRSKKPTTIALEEIREGKVSYRLGKQDEENYLE